MARTHCPTCGVVTDYDTVPHIASLSAGGVPAGATWP